MIYLLGLGMAYFALCFLMDKDVERAPEAERDVDRLIESIWERAG